MQFNIKVTCTLGKWRAETEPPAPPLVGTSESTAWDAVTDLADKMMCLDL